jgi:hypothetical protein
MLISRKQALERWDILPEILREALVSEINSDFIWKTCEAENVPSQRIPLASALTGYVLMGFLHPEDIHEELKSQLGLDPKTSKDIEDAFNKRIFSSLRSEIDKIYKPLSKVEVPVAPVMLQDIGSVSISARPTISAPVPKAGPAPAPAPLPNQAVGQTAGGAPSINIPSLAINKTAAAGTPSTPGAGNAQKPASLSDIGWSKMRSADPVVQLDISRIPPTAPAAKPQAPTIRQPAPVNLSSTGAMGEFERMSMMKKAPTPGGAPMPAPTSAPTMPAPTPFASSAPKPSSDPAPVMLHEDTTFKSSEKNYGFKLSDPKGNAEVDLNSVKQQSVAKPAVLEFGSSTATVGSTGQTPSPSHAVHYTELNSSLSSAPIANSGPRNINQIMPTAPAPAEPAAPLASSAPVPVPMPPRPPQMQTPPPTAPAPAAMPQKPQSQKPAQDQVVVKDFL